MERLLRGLGYALLALGLLALISPAARVINSGTGALRHEHFPPDATWRLLLVVAGATVLIAGLLLELVELRRDAGPRGGGPLR